MIKKIVKYSAWVIGFLALSFISFLIILTALNKKHPDTTVLDIENPKQAQLSIDDSFSITTFNIGYGSLGETEDFFADGGKNSISKSYEQTILNLNTIFDNILSFDSDFLFIQEIDRKSKRSHNTEQYTMLKDKLVDYSSSFAYNYNATWVPVPLNQPLGHVEAGMGVFSKYYNLSSVRHQLEGQESWPINLFELDRCFIETRIPLDNQKELILINLHLSAYDKGGKLRDKQATHLARLMNEEYKNGNYIVLGGDWNQLLSDKQMNDPEFLAKWPTWLVKAPDKLTETGFVWGIDESVMTVRDLVTPYIKGETFETIIDGFLVSPNLEIENVTGHDLKFKNSDHNPVTCTLKFK